MNGKTYKYFKIGLLSLALIIVVISVLPVSRTSMWWVRIFDFPRLQIFVVGLFTVMALLFFYRPLKVIGIAAIIAVAISAGYQFYRIVEFTKLHPVESIRAESYDEANAFDIIICNVYMPNRKSGKLLQLIYDIKPDIIALTETNQWWEDQMAVIEDDYPYHVKYPLDNKYGIHLYSKLELIDPQVNFYVEDDVPSIITHVRLPSGNVIKLYSIHPRPPKPANDTDERDAEIIMVGNSIKKGNEHAIVLGDLNDVGWSHTTRVFKRISGMLDPRVGRGMYNTFNANIPFLRWPLDYIFHTDHFLLVDLERLPHVNSDHFPMYVKLYYAGKKMGQDVQQPDEEDLEEAENKVQEGTQNE